MRLRRRRASVDARVEWPGVAQYPGLGREDRHPHDPHHPFRRSLAPADQVHDLLHVRMPLRHQGHARRRQAALHSGQSQPPGQSGRDLRQGRGGHHEAVLAGATAPAAPAPSGQRTRRRRIRAESAGTRLSTCSPQRLAKIRATNPTELAFFTGRDQMQALSSLWAQQFGTPNWAAHGGLCSVNMAVAGLYTIGYSFWEFGAPDWDHAKLFHPLGRRRGSFVEPAQDRTGQAQAPRRQVRVDQPGAHRLLGDRRRVDPDPARYRRRCSPWPSCTCCSSAGWSTGNSSSATPTRRGSSCRRPACPATACSRATRQAIPWPGIPLEQRFVNGHLPDIAPALLGYGRPSRRATRQEPSFRSFRSATSMTATHRRPSPPNAAWARRRSIALPWRWRTSRSTRPSSCPSPGPICMVASTIGWSAGRSPCMPCAASPPIPTAFKPAARCMCCRCSSARSTGPATSAPGRRIRGASRCARCPKTIPRSSSRRIRRSTAPSMAIRRGPEELVIDAQGKPLRIDRAYSWESPLAAHGVMHMVISNAVNRDPYPIDTLLLFMANMAWNSAMNTGETREMLVRKDENGRVRDSFRRRRRCVPLRNRGLCRSGAARYHLPGALRHRVAARPAHFRTQRCRRTRSAIRWSMPIATCGRGRKF